MPTVRSLTFAALFLAGLSAAAAEQGPASSSVATRTAGAPFSAAVAPTVGGEAQLAGSTRGLSGALRVLFAHPGEHLPLAVRTPGLRWQLTSAVDDAGVPAVSDGIVTAPSKPGIWKLARADAQPVTVITPVLYDTRRGGRLNGYEIGTYAAARSGKSGKYAAPEAFIEVTPQTQDLHVSEHFRLRDFLTHDQVDVWPKYLVLDLRLVDKLELVLQQLRAEGVPAAGLHVMSGFRTPHYNGPGGNGRVKYSRHTYGDAADVWVDADGDGRMDDLNHDGRVDIDDARALVRVVERVEERFPALRGGAGAYKATSAHGPFVHIDARGTPARWASE